MTGYKFTEIANQTSAFLQGPDTERESERELVNALRKGGRKQVRKRGPGRPAERTTRIC